MVTVYLRGVIDAEATASLRHALVYAIMRRRCPRIVVNLQETTAIDPVAIGTLVAAYHTARDMRLTLVFEDGQPRVAADGEAHPGWSAEDLVAELVRDIPPVRDTPAGEGRLARDGAANSVTPEPA